MTAAIRYVASGTGLRKFDAPSILIGLSVPTLEDEGTGFH